MKGLLTILISLFIFNNCQREVILTSVPTAKKIKICAVGDVGMGTQVQAQVAQAMSKENCDRLVVLGDVIYPAGIKNASDPWLEQNFLRYYSSFKKIFVILGNHDYQGSPEAWLEVSKKYPLIIHPSAFFEERIQDICFLYLDTNFSSHYGQIFSQILWLMKSRNECRKTIAFSHHPFLSSGKKHGPAKGFTKKFFEMLIIGQVDYLISGHEHILSDEGLEGGTHFILSGAGGKPEQGNPGFLTLEIDFTQSNPVSYQLIFLP